MQQIIRSPNKPMSDVDAQLDCECALDIPVRDLIDSAIHAGWSPEVIYAAMASVVDHATFAYAEDPDPAEDPIP